MSGSSDDRAALRNSLRWHGALDLAFAALYLFVDFRVAQGRSAFVDAAVIAVSALLAAAGVALLLGRTFARPLALAASSLLLALCAVLVALLVAGAAYLRGVYGPLGQGMAWGSLLVAAVIVEAFGVLPVLQLRLLLRPDVRRHFAVAP